MRPPSFVFAGVLGLIGTFGTADAAVVYHVQSGNAQNNISNPAINASSPLDVTQSGGILNGNHTTGTVRGVADNGFLINEIEQVRNASNFGANGRPAVITRVTINDLIFFNINDPQAGGSANIGVSTDYSASIENPQFWGRFQTNISFTNSGGAQFGSVNIDGGNSVAGTLALNIANVPLNVTRTLTVQAYLELRLGEAFVPSITGNAFSEVLFPTFVLPEGIGVMSASFPLSSGVPTPGALVLFGFGFLGLVHLKRVR